jgi:fructosamine-3-kinase
MDRALAQALRTALGAEVVSARPVHGGDVAISYRVDLSDGRRVFAKTHERPPPGFFTTEAHGLGWLRDAGAVSVPDVLAVSDDPAFLALEWIDTGPARGDTDAALGRDLATLHRVGTPCYGREDRRTTGSRALSNDPAGSWSEFYAERRLLPLARLAREGNALSSSAIVRLETLAGRLDRFVPLDEPPALLHGDLWAGNRMIDTDGRSWLIDPAAHGGHREYDLAMMRLFGGFDATCFAAYDEAFPLADGWRDRVALHQVAPLVVHAIKFDGGYRASAEAAIARYVN